MRQTHCPTCNTKLRRVSYEEKLRVHGKKFEDEEVFWCPKCQQYILEEDFYYNTEE